MRITISTKMLQTAVKQAALATLKGKNPSLPILSHVLIEASGQRYEGRVTITGYNTDAASVQSVDCYTSEPGRVTIDPKSLLELLKVSQESTHIETIDDDPNHVLITVNGIGIKRETYKGEEYPNLPDVTPDSCILIDAQTLVKGISKVRFSAQKDGRPNLQSVRFEVESGTLRLVTTDTHRLSICEIETDSPDCAFSVPVEAIDDLIKVVGKGSGDVLVSSCKLPEVKDTRPDYRGRPIEYTRNPSITSFEFGGSVVIGRNPDDLYPHYSRVIPCSTEPVFTIDASQCLSILKQVRPMLQPLKEEKCKKDNCYRFAFTPNCTTVKVGQPGSETVTASVPMDKSESYEHTGVVFNADYLIEVFQHITGSVSVGIGGELIPCIFVDSTGFKHVLMPMQK